MRQIKYWFLFLSFIAALTWIFALSIPSAKLSIVACNVGQGDAILTTYKNVQILTDGGPGSSVMECLGRYMPFWDRKIEMIISTHPDADHSAGLVEVTKRYDVASILINPINSSTQTIKALENQVGSKGISIIKPEEGKTIRLGLIYLDIVNPSRSQTLGLATKIEGDSLGFYKPEEPTNEYSITYKLSFGKFSGLFTGDIGPDVSNRIASENKIGEVDYIKIPHHGSKNGITENLLKHIMPKVAVISVGKNSYGHPSPEVTNLLEEYKVKTYRTDEMGDIVLVTDGSQIWIKK